MHGHDPHAVAPLLQDGRLPGLTFGRLVAQLLDESTEGEAAALLVAAGHLPELQHVGEHLLARPAHHEAGMGPRRLEQLSDRVRDRDLVAGAVQPPQQLQGVGDRQQAIRTLDLARRQRAGDPERMEAAEAVAVRQERLVVHCEQRPAEGREDGQLVVRPLDGGQHRAHRRHLVALVERAAADQEMAQPAGLEGVDVAARDVAPPGVEAAEQQRDVPRLDGHGHRLVAARRRPRLPLGDGPAALADEPCDERPHRIRERCLDRPTRGTPPGAVGARDRQRHDRRLLRVVRTVRRQRHVAGQPGGAAGRRAPDRRARRAVFPAGAADRRAAHHPTVVPVRGGVPRRAHQRREGMVDEALDGGDGAEARGERDMRHFVPRELHGHLAVDPDVGAAEAVDRLLRIADDEELPRRGDDRAPVALGRILRRQQEQNLGLERIGVLELVDEDPRVSPLRRGTDVVVAADQVSRPQQEVDEVEAPRLRLRLPVAFDRRPELLPEQRGEIGVRHRPEALEHGDDSLVLLENVRAGKILPVHRAEPLARSGEAAVRGQLDQLRLDEVVVPLRAHVVGLPDRPRDRARRLGVEEEAVAAAVGGPVRQGGEAHQVPDHFVDGRLAPEVRFPAPGPFEVPPFRQLPGRAPQAPRRAVAARLTERGPVPAPERAPHARRRVVQGRLQPAVEHLPEQALRAAVVENLEPGVDAGLHGALPQQVGAECVDGADLRLLQVGDGLVEAPVALGGGGVGPGRGGVPPGLLERSSKPQLQLARGLLGEGDGQDLVHGGAPGREHLDDALHQDAGLPRPGGRLHDDRLVERRPDAVPDVRVGERRHAHRGALIGGPGGQPDRGAAHHPCVPRAAPRPVRTRPGSRTTGRHPPAAPEAGCPPRPPGR